MGGSNTSPPPKQCPPLVKSFFRQIDACALAARDGWKERVTQKSPRWRFPVAGVPIGWHGLPLVQSEEGDTIMRQRHWKMPGSAQPRFGRGSSVPMPVKEPVVRTADNWKRQRGLHSPSPARFLFLITSCAQIIKLC